MIVIRYIREIEHGRFDEYKALYDKTIARYVELGLPRPKGYRVMFGGDHGDTWVGTTEWESLSALDNAASSVLFVDPELVALGREFAPLVKSTKWEILEVL